MLKRMLAGRRAALVIAAILLLALMPLVVYAASTSTPLDISKVATEPTYTQMITGGVEFANNGRVGVLFRSAEATQTATIVISAQATYRGYALVDPTFTLAPGRSKIMGPFPTDVFNDSSGNVTVVGVSGAGGAGGAGAILISMTTFRY